MKSKASSTQGIFPKLEEMDYSVLQQCMHCGMCLPTCPTYSRTKRERHSPRGRIALMRSIADGRMELSEQFAQEMYFCLGCLACQSACPAGVDYARLFETARAEVEEAGLLCRPERNFWRWLAVKTFFMNPRLLRLAGRLIWIYQATGMQTVFRRLGFTRLLPRNLRELEPQTPPVRSRFSHQLIAPVERPQALQAGRDSQASPRYRVGLLTGCVQDLVFSDINRDTVDVLLANHCEVVTPPVQPCCGSLHAHNGEPGLAAQLARQLIDLMEPEKLDAIISNAGGCGSHLKHYGPLLAHDPVYAPRARVWDSKVRDIHEWLVGIGFRRPTASPFADPMRVTYHESCHLSHGQKITRQPREILASIPGIELVELTESNWCCGSAGIYNITQPEMAGQLQQRKVGCIQASGAGMVATSNPGCHLQVANGLKGLNGKQGAQMEVTQPVSLLARAYRAEGPKEISRLA